MPAVHLPKKPWVSDTVTQRGSKTIRQKKQILVVDNNDKAERRTVDTGAGAVRFEHGTAVLPNDARGRDIAAEIRAKALDPGGVVVVKDREGFYRDPTHRNFWGSHTGVPWAKYDELGRRIPDDAAEDDGEQRDSDGEDGKTAH